MVWKDSRYCTAFPMPYFSGCKAVSRDTTSFISKELISSLDRIASFFVAFVFVTLVASKDRWQRYSTAAVMAIFIALLIWCGLETWGERPIPERDPPPQPTEAELAQLDNQGATQLSVCIDGR